MLTGLGHNVKLIVPEAVRPFVKKGNFTSGRDAAVHGAAASAASFFSSAKSLEQQGVLALHRARSLVKQQTMLANAIRSLATEFTLTVPNGIGRLRGLMELVDTDATFPIRARQVIRGLLDHCHELAESIETLRRRLSLTRGTIKPLTAWPRLSVRSPRR
jgi:transposase